MPPEACVNPMDLIELARTKVKTADGKGFPIHIEFIDKDGKSQELKPFS